VFRLDEMPNRELREICGGIIMWAFYEMLAKIL
jgi:hypothetical protein